MRLLSYAQTFAQALADQSQHEYMPPSERYETGLHAISELDGCPTLAPAVLFRYHAVSLCVALRHSVIVSSWFAARFAAITSGLGKLRLAEHGAIDTLFIGRAIVDKYVWTSWSRLFPTRTWMAVEWPELLYLLRALYGFPLRFV